MAHLKTQPRPVRLLASLIGSGATTLELMSAPPEGVTGQPLRIKSGHVPLPRLGTYVRKGGGDGENKNEAK